MTIVYDNVNCARIVDKKVTFHSHQDLLARAQPTLEVSSPALVWQPSHTTQTTPYAHGNAVADRAAEAGLDLPAQPPDAVADPRFVMIHVEVWAPPHKCWARKLKDAFQGRGPPGTHLSPYHSHTGIHPASWAPLFQPGVRYRNVWRRWLLGQEQWQGLEYYLWERRKPPPCTTCGHSHARNIHTGIAVCSRFHHLRDVLFHTYPANAHLKQ